MALRLGYLIFSQLVQWIVLVASASPSSTPRSTTGCSSHSPPPTNPRPRPNPAALATISRHVDDHTTRARIPRA
jgi:hypothetical protein